MHSVSGGLDIFFSGLDTVGVSAGGVKFRCLYDENFFDDSLGGFVFGENAPVLTAAAVDVAGLARGDSVEVEMIDGRCVCFRVLDVPRRDGAGLAFVPLSRS